MMNRLSLICCVLLLFSACSKKNINPDEPTEFHDENWIRLRIPTGGELKAVAGSIDDTLVVSSKYDTYMITEQGKKFTKTTRNLNNTPGLLMRKDTIFALSMDGIDIKENRRYASLCNYYTADKGLNWKAYLNRIQIEPTLLGVVKSRSNVTYELNYHIGPDAKGNGTNFVLRTTISKAMNGFSTKFEHPVKDHQPINLYLDDQDRMYIPTGGTISEDNVYIGGSISKPAYLYISKKPVE